MKLLYSRVSSQSVHDVGQRLEQAAAQLRLEIVGVIDLCEGLCGQGITSGAGCHIYEVCNVRRAQEVLKRYMHMSTALPCRISVYEEGGVTKVATILPTVLLDIFEASELWLVANQIQDDIKAIIDAAVSA